MGYKHRIVEITADFELEPVIAEYVKKYSNKDYANYKILFKTNDEHDIGEFSYIILLQVGAAKKEKTPSFYEFLKSYCMYENRRAMLNDHILPQIGQGHSFGSPKPSSNTKPKKAQLTIDNPQP